MPGLLQNKEKLEKEIEQEATFSIENGDEEKDAKGVTADKVDEEFEKNKKINLDRYRDPGGLTVKKMDIGLWFVRNRKHFIFIFMIVMAMIGAVTWGRFFYVYGSYVIVGMKYDEQLSRGIVENTVVGHDFFKQRAPKNIELGTIRMVKGANDKYDFLVEARNPNDNYWAEIESHISVAGKDLAYEKNFILPNETKQILITGKELDNFSRSVKFVKDKTLWHRINKHKYPNWKYFSQEHLDIELTNIEFTPADKTVITEKVPLNNLNFTVKNKTAYNYRGINMNIIIYGVNNQILILDEYALNTFMSGETRTISITLPGDYPVVGKIDVIPEINITRDDIYIKFDGGSGEIK